MTSIVTMTTRNLDIKQVVSNEDPVDLYLRLEQFVSQGKLLCYSLLTLKGHKS